MAKEKTKTDPLSEDHFVLSPTTVKNAVNRLNQVYTVDPVGAAKLFAEMKKAVDQVEVYYPES